MNKKDLLLSRRKMFESIGLRLANELVIVSQGGTDTEIKGKSGERAFRKWLQKQIPSRFSTIDGAVISINNEPTTQRDCLIFNAAECPVFRQIDDKPDILPIEGIIGCFEVNIGKSGATYAKLKHDCEKLSEIGNLYMDHKSFLPSVVRVKPINSTIPEHEEPFMFHRTMLQQPILYIFSEDLQGSIKELSRRIAIHNKSVSICASIAGVFILNKGFILHYSDNGWSHIRTNNYSLAYMEAEPWEVLLKMMSIVWNQIAKGPYMCPDLGAYYADKNYFAKYEKPRINILDDPDYITQREAGFVSITG